MEKNGNKKQQNNNKSNKKKIKNLFKNHLKFLIKKTLIES